MAHVRGVRRGHRGDEGYEVTAARGAACSCRRLALRRCGCCLDPRCFTAMVCVFGALMVGLHAYVLPAATKHYNDACYPDQRTRRHMRHLLVSVAEVLDAMNETWWVDYGTLLGIWRTGDILPHDADVDFGRILPDDKNQRYDFDLKFAERLDRYNITGNQLTAGYKHVKADIYQWQLVVRNTTRGPQSILSQHWPPWVQENAVEKLKYILTPDQPPSLYVPTKRVKFHGRMISVPNDYMAIIRSRYPFTWWFTVPYKWRCYIPI